MKRIFDTYLGVMLMACSIPFVACTKQKVEPVIDTVEEVFEPLVFGTMDRNVVSVETEDISTKVSVTSSILSFKCEATIGTPGSETAATWNNVVFTSDEGVPPTYSGDKYWPHSDPNYHFYAVTCSEGAASSPSLSFSASGTNVACDGSKDVVCAYLPYGLTSSTAQYRTKNTLEFEHIYARVSTVTVNSDAVYKISNITIWLVNAKTGGVYNLRTGKGRTDGTGWSSLTPVVDGVTQIYRNAGNIAAGNSNTGIDNDLYIIPGTYSLKATWTASVDDYTETFENKISTSTVNIVAGKRNSISVDLTGNGTELVFSVSLSPWTTNAIADVEFQHPSYFGSLEVAPAPLYYSSANGFEIIDNDWNHDSYNSIYGKNDGSYYFTFADLGSYFDSDQESFVAYTDVIDNAHKVTYAGHDDWRLMSRDDWRTLVGSISRTGSVVNGNSGSCYAAVSLSGITHAGSSSFVGVLFFPDGKTISGKSLSAINDEDISTSMNGSELDVYLSQGCVFFPSSGHFISSWSRETSNVILFRNETAYPGGFQPFVYAVGSMMPAVAHSMSDYYLPVRLVRDVL